MVIIIYLRYTNTVMEDWYTRAVIHVNIAFNMAIGMTKEFSETDQG